MRKILVLGLMVGLSGCATDGGMTGSTDSIKKVQAAAVSACRFLPAAKFVADLLLSGNVLVSTAESVAGEICNAVTNRPLADGPGDRRPRVRGMVVRGQFVK